MNKETFTINEINTLSSLVLKVTTVLAVLLGGYVLWRYLSLLDIAYIFSSVAMQSSLLIVIAVVYVPVTLFVMLTVFLPGITLNYFVYPCLNSDELKGYIKMVCVPFISLFLAMLNVVADILLQFYFASLAPSFTILVCSVGCFLISEFIVIALYMCKCYRRTERQEVFKGKVCQKIKDIARISFFIYIPSFIAVFSYVFLMSFGFEDIKTYTGVFWFVSISIITMMLSFVPSCFTFFSVGKQPDFNTICVVGMVCVCVLLTVVPNLANILLILSLKSSGIIDYNKYMFYISSVDVPQSAFKRNVWDIKKGEALEGYLTVSGSVLFALGSYTLICPESRAVSSVQTLKNYIKGDYEHIFSEEAPSLKKLREVVADCHVLNKSASQLIIMKVTNEEPELEK